MNVELVQMDPRIARIHFLDYKKAVARHREQRKKALEEKAKTLGKEFGQVRIEKTKLEKEDEELLRTYQELCKGLQVVNLIKAMRVAGVDKQFLPRLAIARADAEIVKFDCNRGNATFKTDTYWPSRNQRNPEAVTISNEFPAETWNSVWRANNQLPALHNVRAIVPKIPPHLRPDEPKNYYILWEPNWEELPPDPDPILLRRIGSTFYAVVATWDMTPIEQGILESRS